MSPNLITGVLLRRDKDAQTQIMPCEHGGKDWRSASTYEGLPSNARAETGRGHGIP